MKTLVCALLLGCAAFAAQAASPEAQDPKEPKPPKEREYSYIYDLLNNSVFRPTTRVLDPALFVRRMSSNPREAENVDDQDQVRLPSTWWTPRIGFRPVSVEQMMRGPGPGKGPAPGRWTITQAKTQGVTPGFQIKDAKGDRFIIKFDPKSNPELVTAPDVVGSYLFWAAGYNVPENTIAFFRPESLDIDEKATYKNMLGEKKPFTQEFLDDLLTRVHRGKDGRFRCVASRYLKGKPLGPFKYNGRRKDDPDDLIPHEHRRELRGLWPVMAWLNHADCRGPNSLDMWVKENGRSFVRHHLIDFGSILGSSAVGPRSAVTGTEYYVDAGVMTQQFLSLGLVPFEWEDTVDPKMPSVGYIESKDFDPVRWRPDYPNPAFDERTERDVRWGARIVAGFTPEHIRAAIQAGQYTDLRAAQYLERVLIERRAKIISAWLRPGTEGTLDPP